MILLVASNKDVASLNIKKHILNCHKFEKTSDNYQGNNIYKTTINHKKVKLVTLNKDPVYAQNLAEHFIDTRLIVFISRHSSESATPTLSVHTPGNLGEAELGGLSRRVSFSPANAMRETLKVMMQLKDEMQLDYEVSYEATHHGPSLNVPTMFAELGSSPTQWNDSKAAEVVAHATTKAISEFGSYPAKTVLGVGGLHYNARFTKVALENDVAFGHIIPKYAVPNVNVDILRQCLERTLERVQYAILDWKGIKGENKLPLVKMLDEIGLPIEKI